MTLRDGEVEIVVEGIVQELLNSDEISEENCRKVAQVVKNTLLIEDGLLQELDEKARKVMEQYSDKMEGVNSHVLLQKIKARLAEEMNIVL